MNYRFVFDVEFYRTIPAALIDARVGTPLNGQIGSVIQAYTDAEVDKASAPNVLPYKIEALANGGFVGYITLQVNNGVATLYQKVVRPNFQYDIVEINQEISSFVQSNDWNFDYI